ncbi:hypothetical protein J26TS2_07650 [Shouchella clausii]|uniref:hypothetical protein n=1 Tax=Shouchella tritolerans TaxID=2979466 RepID=UPI001B1C8456|nr:hypothetical protein [Shouchella tritolerans]GIN10898.1 hypothetical protein J26TS2_07650 [Shouchella clausii]
MFKNKKQEIRTSYELALLEKAQKMVPKAPPLPWRQQAVLSASGVIAAGWDSNENIILLTSSGYSINHAMTGERILRDRDTDRTENNIIDRGLKFIIPDSGEEIDLFGIEAGDGVHLTVEGWSLEVIYPWWPRASVIIDHVFVQGHEYLLNATMLDIPRLDGWIKCGFAPSGNKFMVIGSGGAMVFAK